MSRPRTKRDTKKQIVDRFLHEAALMKTSPEDIATMRQMLERVTLEELITKYLPEWESSLYKQRPVPIREWVNDHMGLKGQIYPMLLDDMEEMFEDNYSEIILSGCIDHNALIMEADGGLPTLGERIGTERDVLTIMDAKGMSTSPTVNTRDSGVKKVRQITLRNGYELKLTPDHRVRVYRDGYQWVPAEDIVEGDYVLTPRKVTTTPSVKTTLDEAKFLAYWITNGSLKKNHTSARYASANLATVKELVEVLDRLGYDSSIYPLKGTTAWEVYVKRVKSSGFLDKLLTSDVVHTAHSAKVPDAITRASNKVVATYLNRVWAAEGTCYSGSNGKSPPRFVLAMASERFVKQVQLLLLRFGIQSRVRLNTHYDKRRGTTTYTYELAVTGIRDLQLFLGSIGPVLGKEDRCEEIADYCAEREANTNVDLLPLTLGELNKMITESDIIRLAGDPWWGISTRPSQRVSRDVQAKFIEDYPGHPIAEWLASEFPEDVAYTPVTSNVELDEPIPTGDIGALNGNRFIANGIDTHNSIGFGKCKSGSTVLDVIIDDDKWERMTIEDVVNLPQGTDIKVLSANDDYTLQAHQVVGRVMSGVKPVYRVKLRSQNYTDATAEHPILTNEGYKRVAELQVGDLVATARSLPTNEDQRVDPNLVVFLAYMLADGSTTSSPRFTKSDAYTLSEFERAVTALGGAIGTRRTVGRNKVTQELSVTGLNELIREYGYAGVKSVDKRVPTDIINANRSTIGLFLSRFIECDGHLHKTTRTIEISLGNEGLADDLKTLFLKLGIHTRVKTKTIKMRHSGENYDVWTLTFSGEDVVSFLKEFPVGGEKSVRAQEIVNAVVTRPSSNFDVVPIDYEGAKRLRAYYGTMTNKVWAKYLNVPKGQWLSRQKLGMIKDYFGHLPEWADQYLNSDIFWDRVESVTYRGEEPVFDIEVPETKNFVANGIVVHNSYLVALILTRIVYELSCYKNPQHALGLADGSPIVIPNVALKLATAQEVVFRYMQNFIRGSEYFREEFPPDKDLTKSMQFPHSITVQPVATTNASVIGLNVYSACFPGEQEFLMSDGSTARMIDYVDKPVTVPTLDVHGKVRDITTRVVKTGTKSLVRMTLSNGDTIESTGDQRFQDETGEWVRAEDAQGRRIRFNRVQAVWGESSVPHAALKETPQHELPGVPRNVSGYPTNGASVLGRHGEEERRGRPRQGDLCRVWATDDYDNGNSHEVPRHVVTGVPCEVPGCTVESRACGEGTDHEGAGTRVEAEPRPSVQGISAEGNVQSGAPWTGGLSGTMERPGVQRTHEKHPSRVVGNDDGGRAGKGYKSPERPNVHLHQSGRGTSPTEVEAGAIRSDLVGLSGGTVGVRVEEHPVQARGANEGVPTGLLHSVNEHVPRSEVFVHSGQAPWGVGGEEGTNGESSGSRVGRDRYGYGPSSSTPVGGEAQAEEGHDNLRGNLEDWTLVECIAVEPIPDSVQDVYDLEDTGSTHIFFAKTGSGFVQAKNCLDEVNFFERIVNSKRGDGVNEVFDQAENMYRMLHNRITSRFLHPDGTYPGKLLMVSSARYPDDFTTRKYEEAKAAGKKVFYRRYSQWEPKYGKSGYPGKTFQVSIGNSAVRPRVIRDASHDAYEPNLDDIAQLKSEGIKIIDVPEEHRTAFEIDVDAAVRDIAGYPTLSRHPFFRDMEPWNRSFKRAEERGLRHPWTKLLHVTLDDGSTWIRDYLDETKRLYPHFVHIDLALTQDAAGVSVVRLDGVEEIEHLTMVTDPTTGEVTESPTMEYAPNLTAVLLQQIMPVKGREIPISKVRRIVLDLVNWGFNIKKVTFDAYQSADSIQQFRQLNIDAGQVSMDRSTEPSTTLKELLEQDRLDVYNHPVLKDEAAAVELDLAKGKIDHPPGGCLTGDTLVMTNKGLVPIETLAEAGSNHTFWAHGVTTGGDILVAEAYNAHLTGRNQHVVKVMLSNGKHIRATPDHRFMLEDGSYLPAEELTAGQALMAPGDVVTVTDVFPDGKADVYDITVPATSNFLTGAGVAVHNSKDVLDSLTGAVYSAVTYVTLNGGQVIKGEFVEDDRDSPVLISFDYGDENSFLEDYKWLYD